MTERDPINDISVAEEIYLELGARVFSALSAENNNYHRYIQGVSDLFYQTDDSGEDWSDVVWMIHLDEPGSYSWL